MDHRQRITLAVINKKARDEKLEASFVPVVEHFI
jgi:hypothetical protein